MNESDKDTDSVIDDDEQFVTATGKTITGADLDAMAEEIENADYDLSKIRPRGRPLLGDAPAKVLQVRLDPELSKKLDYRAETEQTTKSEIMRQALSRYLAS